MKTSNAHLFHTLILNTMQYKYPLPFRVMRYSQAAYLSRILYQKLARLVLIDFHKTYPNKLMHKKGIPTKLFHSFLSAWQLKGELQ